MGSNFPSPEPDGIFAEDTPPRLSRERKPTLNSQRVSRTDPEASIISRRGLGTMLAYKQHFTVDSLRRVVTAVEVTPAATEDCEQVPQLLDQQPLWPREFCGDSHYGVPKVYAELQRRGILAAIPRCSPQSRRPKADRLSAAAF